MAPARSTSTADGALRVTERVETCFVVGSTAQEIAAVLALTGPRDAARGYHAYTAWEVAWSYRAAPRGDAFGVADAFVHVTVTTTLPRWLSPVTAPASLREAWRDYEERIAAHERGHGLVGVEAGKAVLAALRGLPPFDDAAALDAAATRAAEGEISLARARDLRHDAPEGP